MSRLCSGDGHATTEEFGSLKAVHVSMRMSRWTRDREADQRKEKQATPGSREQRLSGP